VSNSTVGLRARRGGAAYRALPELTAETSSLASTDPGASGDLIGTLRSLASPVGLGRKTVRFPLVSAPDLGELKIARYRLYFAEPPSIVNLVLGLSLAQKRPHGDPGINTAQDADIAVGAGRYTRWQAAGRVPPAPWP